VQRKHGDERLDGTRRTQHVAVQGLGRTDAQRVEVAAPHVGQRVALDHVADARGRAVRIAVAHVARLQAGQAQRLRRARAWPGASGLVRCVASLLRPQPASVA
jgi:hypothetical protein